MVSLYNFITFFFCVSTFFHNPIFSQQIYDITECSSNSPASSASTYLCTSKDQTCEAYVIYRAQPEFQSLSSISSLFNLTGVPVAFAHLLELNTMTEEESGVNLTLGREIIVSVSCSCFGRYFQADILYDNSKTYSVSEVACRVFEGLVKPKSLEEENQESRGNLLLKVPIQCSCPDKNQTSKGVNFLVTYPVVELDSIDVIARKFGVSDVAIREANTLPPYSTIFAETTLLVPVMEDTPFVKLNPLPEDSSPTPLASIPVRKIDNDTELSLRVFLLVGFLVVVVLVTLAILVCICMWTKNGFRSFQPLSPKTTTSSFNFSPDFLDGMSKLRKHSLINFSLNELRIATNDFDETCKIGTSVYRGKNNRDTYMGIEQFNSETEAQHVVYILTKINHLNIVKLEGCCYDMGERYLVFEFADNGSLRDCLSSTATRLNWERRIQIAFDIAMGLHYIHYSTKPSFVHRNINSRNVVVSKDWRAKISGFRFAKPVNCSEENIESMEWSDSVIVGRKEYMAPEYVVDGLGSVKVDVFAFGMVLLELLSSKSVVTEGKLLNECIDFMDDVGVGSNCVEKLKEFMDPCLGEDYPMGDALCLGLLAKACVQHDPRYRPTMNDILKALSRIL